MKKFFSLVVMALVAIPTFAQISEGSPRADVLPTGNRLEKGVWGVFIGAGMTADKHDNNLDDKKFHVTPIVNVKYMVTDKFETRLGIELGKNKSRVGTEYKLEEGDNIKGVNKTVESHNYFNPGFAYHFSNKNILDVYMGAELPFGWERNVSKVKSDGDHMGSNFDRQFNIGAGAFIGLQAFVGRLPLAIGLEYGLQSLFTVGDGKTKTIVTDKEGKSQTTYSHALAGNGFKGLSSRKGEILSQARITVSYYFK